MQRRGAGGRAVLETGELKAELMCLNTGAGEGGETLEGGDKRSQKAAQSRKAFEGKSRGVIAM